MLAKQNQTDHIDIFRSIRVIWLFYQQALLQ